MKCNIEIQLDNDCLYDYNGNFQCESLSQVLDSISESIVDSGKVERTIKDVNGNTIGKVELND